jgi:hypothetical protein
MRRMAGPGQRRRRRIAVIGAGIDEQTEPAAAGRALERSGSCATAAARLISPTRRAIANACGA